MAKYSFVTSKTKRTPQNKPVPLREHEMFKNNAGGYTFKADTWLFLNRCLIIGTSQNSFYQSKFTISSEFAQVVLEAAAEDAKKTADAILEASNGTAVNNSSAIFALAILSNSPNMEAKKEFKRIFLPVVRTASHFYEWMEYTKGIRGSGKIIKEMRKLWFIERKPEDVAFQLLKYNQRNGYAAKDVIRLARVKPETEEMSKVFKYFLKGWDKLPESIPEEKSLQQIYWYEKFKSLGTTDGSKMDSHEQRLETECISNGKLTQEMATKIRPISKQSWKLITEQMPVGALVRHLGALTFREIISPNDTKTLDGIEAKLTNPEYMRKARIHPLDCLKALKIYEAGGMGGKSDNRYAPVPRILDVLGRMVDQSFNYLEPTGLRYGVFVDVSGSMNSCQASGAEVLTALEVAGVLALSIAKAEKNYKTFAFDTIIRDFVITKQAGVTEVLRSLREIRGGGTDISLMFQTLLKTDLDVDVVVGFTDNETWAGQSHPFQTLEQYRRKVGHNVKVVYSTLSVNKAVLSAPEDRNALDIAGAHANIPKMIQEFAQGKF